MKRTFLWAALLLNGTAPALACTGISFTARDGAFVTARTIEWGESPLPSGYVVIPRQHETVSYTPTGANGLSFRAKYGAVGLTIVREEFIAEGINEAGLSAGLFYFPHYGKYPAYDSTRNDRTLSDLQYVAWILSQFSSVDEVKAATQTVRVVSIDPSVGSTVHWRIADASGKQVVLEFIDGEPGFLGIPGDVTPPSRFVRIAFYKATAPACETGLDAVLQSFHILNNFDIPIGIEHPEGHAPDIPSATQWTSAIDLANRRLYYKTSYNNSIRCIDLKKIDFARIGYQAHPLDTIQQQPIEELSIS